MKGRKLTVKLEIDVIYTGTDAPPPPPNGLGFEGFFKSCKKYYLGLSRPPSATWL